MTSASFAAGMLLLTAAGSAVSVAQTNGVASIQSAHSVAASIDRLDSLARSRGMTVFARIDFAADAKKAGLEMRPEQLLIFGNPKAGTPLMEASPTAALDLPLKVLAWQDREGKVWLSYTTPEYIKERHGLPGALVKNIGGIRALVAKAAE